MEIKETVTENIIRILRKITSLPIWLWIVIPIVCVFLVVVIFGWLTIDAISGNSTKKFPTDAELEIIFDEKRNVFEKLIQMSNENPKVIWITHDYTDVLGASRSGEMGKGRAIGFSEERWEEYKQLFKDIGLNTGLARLGQDGGIYTEGIYLIADSKGMLGGTEKGYVYTTKKIDKELMVDSIDGVSKDIDEKRIIIKKDYAIFYKKLEENWYIYIETD